MLNFIFLCLFLVLGASAHEYLETKTHLDVFHKVTELDRKYGGHNVLVVFDIDNTLLKANQPIGSDQWFEWQAEAIKTLSSDASYKSFDELLKAQADFFQMSSMSLTENTLPQIVGELKRSRHPMLLLTSRGPELRNVTERELERNKLWFSENAFMQGIPFTFMETPFKARVSFMNGIFMTSGHHKGEALVYLLRKAGKNYKAIVFVDDHDKHTRRVYDTFAPSASTEVVTFRYGKEDEAVAAFKTGSKSQVQSQARYMIQAMRQIFAK